MRIAVFGAGTWGTALAAMLADAGRDVALWGRDPGAMADLAARRENVRYLPGRILPGNVRAGSDVVAAAADAEVALIALPSHSVRQVVTQILPHLPAGAPIVCAAKGLEPGSRMRVDEILAQVTKPRGWSLLSGPNFARELARGLPAAAVLAAADPAVAAHAQQAFVGTRLRVYATDDVVGVAVGGALKNVVAIAAGCSDGLGFGANARAALITRGLAEMSRLAVRLGGHPMTLAGLAGLGDLVLTCTDDLSRNRRVGLALVTGEPVAQIMARLGEVAEGVATAGLADELARELNVDMPITAHVAAVLAGRQSPREAVADLLSRDIRSERG